MAKKTDDITRAWKVWKELPNEESIIVYEGTEKECRKYLKDNGGSKNFLYVGYILL